MGSIYLPDDLKSSLVRAARLRGFTIGRGRQSQLAEYIAYLVRLDERAGKRSQQRHNLKQALGLLAQPGEQSPTDAEIEELLGARRMGQ
jgi:hypothetical protein